MTKTMAAVAVDLERKCDEFLEKNKPGESAKSVFDKALAELKAGGNPAGIEPTEFKIVILSEFVDPMQGGLHKPPTAVEKETWGQTVGYVVAISDMAFTDGEGREWTCAKPAVGDKVIYSKYAGQVFEIGKLSYRIITDKDLCAIVREEE